MQPDFSYAYIHAIDPFAWEVWSNVGIRWYGLAYLAGFYAGYLIIRWMAQRGLSPLKPELVSDFVFCIACGTIIGGRLGYCLFYSPDLLFHFNGSFPFWGVLAINQGGMASHGGMIGIVAACIYFAKKQQINSMHLMDLTTLGGCVGIFFGRIANFINAELIGRPLNWAAPWAVKFPQDMLTWSGYGVGHDSARLQELKSLVSRFGISAEEWQALIQKATYSGAAYEQLQQILEKLIKLVQQGDIQVRTVLAPLLIARHPSQLYEAFLEGMLLCLIVLIAWRKPRQPGVIAGVFFTFYAVVRFVGEQFRMPDAHIGFQLFGLTRGQWLSTALLVAGIFLWVWSAKRRSTLLGGWGKRAASVY